MKYSFLMRAGVGISVGAMMTACATTSSPMANGPIAPDTAGPLTQIMGEAGAVDAIEGVWRSRGYGYVVEISDSGLTRYHIDGETCFATPEAAKGTTETLSLEFQYFRAGTDSDWAILQLLPDDTWFVFDRLDSLPALCAQPVATDYETVFGVYERLIGEHYAFFEERGIDWPELVEAARAELPSIENDKAFFDLLAGMIDGFSDSHTKLIATIDGERLRQQDGQGETLPMVRRTGENDWIVGLFVQLFDEILDPGYVHTGEQRLLWGTIDERVGYIQVFTMGGFTGTEISDPAFRDAELAFFDAEMDKAMTAFAEMDAVILDLSNNRGGYDAIARRLAGLFADEAYVGYRTEVPGSSIAPRVRMIEPADDTRFTGPVYLLTSDVTVSGGELATLALQQLPNVTQVGTTTRGSFSTVMSKPLPNGWVVELSNEIVSAPDGRVFEEAGIAPDIEMDVFPADDPVGGHKAAINTIVSIATNKAGED